MKKIRYNLGIDLGTSNSALAFASAESDVQVLPIPQVHRPGELVQSLTLASALYVPQANEVREEDLRLPWQSEATTEHVVGRWALERGSLSPDRLIVSAKSWLAHPYMDAHEAFLPWNSELPTLYSPLQALTLYLEHLRDAFVHSRKEAGEKISLADQNLVLTIPASFDERARQLTLEAAQKAGLKNVSLLEEPQAAFYAFMSQNERSWQKSIQAGDLVLVCDLGGGTSDFSLISIQDQDGQLALERIAVGDHLLLGGDNMDMALAHSLREEFSQQGITLDHWQFLSLVAEARRAKEALFSRTDLAQVPISVTKRSAKLMANTVSIELTRSRLEKLIIDGFFPLCASSDVLEKKQLGIQEWGLAYENDPAITKHLAAFLRRAYQTLQASPQLQKHVPLRADDDALYPSAILFNGGVFQAAALRDRIIEVLNAWNPGHSVRVLENSNLDLAVAHGAAYFARVKAAGKGLRIKAGTTRSYYIALEAAGLAVPGLKAPVRGLCVVPQGTEEGVTLPSPRNRFGLQTGESASFRFFSSSQRGMDSVGTIVSDAETQLDDAWNLTVNLPGVDGKKEVVPVSLEAVLNDVGTLQVFMKQAQSDQKWQLEFDLRKSEGG